MNTLSLNEFSLLNKEEKIKAFDRIKKSIELQKKHYFNQHKDDDIPIRFYCPQENYPNFQSIKYNNDGNENEKNNYQNNDLLSSSSFSSNNSIEKERKLKLINKAKSNVLEVKKEMEKLKKINKYDIENNGNELNKCETIQEIDYIIESTTNSFNSSRKSLTNNINNYVAGNPSIINGMENNKHNKKNNFINYENLYKNELKNLLFNSDNNDFSITHRRNNKNINNEYSHINSKTNIYNSKSGNNFINNNTLKNKNVGTNRVKNNNNKLSLDSEKTIKNTNKGKVKLDLKEKFDREYYFNEDINSKNNKQSRNKNKSKTTRYKSLSNKNKINPSDISNKLYNMQKIINEKINKKKEELEQKEMINCTFIPKIDYNSKKIMEKLENKNKEKIKEKYKIIDLIPRSSKNSNMLNSYKDQFLNAKAKMQDNHENDELRQNTFKHKINKNHSFCYRNPNNINGKYNTIDLPQENKIYRALNTNNECDMNNIYNQVNKPKNIKQTFLNNNNKNINKKIINENNYNKLYLNNEGIDNDRKNVEEYYNSKYKYNYNYNIPEKSEYNKYGYSNIINKTESNNNYFNYNDNFCDNLSSKQNFNINNNIISQNDKIRNSKSLRNLYHNNLNNMNNNYVYEPQIYKNRNYINNQYDYKNTKINNINKIKEIQIGYNTGNKNIFLNDNDNYRPIKLNENLGLINDNIYRKGKIMTVDNNNCIPKPYERLSYQNQDYNRGVYIKKTVKNFSRNFSYTHRSNKLNLNDACNHKHNDKVINNRVLIEKLLFEEE